MIGKIQGNYWWLIPVLCVAMLLVTFAMTQSAYAGDHCKKSGNRCAHCKAGVTCSGTSSGYTCVVTTKTRNCTAYEEFACGKKTTWDDYECHNNGTSTETECKRSGASDESQEC